MINPPNLNLKNVCVNYQSEKTKNVLENISGQFSSNSMTAIIGSNGAGKTTLLSAIIGRIKLDSGEIFLDYQNKKNKKNENNEKKNINNKISCLPQQNNIDRSFPISVFDFVALGFWNEILSWKSLNFNQKEQVFKALDSVGLPNFAFRNIEELSSGQFQRILFARLILQNAEIILLDEPFNAIDTKTTSELLKIVQNWNKEGRTIIAVLHDLKQVKNYFPQSLLLDSGKLIAWDSTDKVLLQDKIIKEQHESLGCC